MTHLYAYASQTRRTWWPSRYILFLLSLLPTSMVIDHFCLSLLPKGHHELIKADRDFSSEWILLKPQCSKSCWKHSLTYSFYSFRFPVDPHTLKTHHSSLHKVQVFKSIHLQICGCGFTWNRIWVTHFWVSLLVLCQSTSWIFVRFLVFFYWISCLNIFFDVLGILMLGLWCWIWSNQSTYISFIFIGDIMFLWHTYDGKLKARIRLKVGLDLEVLKFICLFYWLID